jgi:hypothetical protein
MRFLNSILILLLMSFQMTAWAESATAPLKQVPVQSEGRVKPFDTLAREALAVLHGKSTFQKKPAYEIMFTMLLAPTAMESTPMVELTHAGVKEALRFPKEQKYFSISEIMKSDRLSLLMQDLNAKREAKDKLDPYFQALQRLENQIWTFKAVVSGEWFAAWPPKE